MLPAATTTGRGSAGPPAGTAEAVVAAERLGFDSVWTAEAYGSDALTPLAWWGSRTSRIRLVTVKDSGPATSVICRTTPAIWATLSGPHRLGLGGAPALRTRYANIDRLPIVSCGVAGGKDRRPPVGYRPGPGTVVL